MSFRKNKQLCPARHVASKQSLLFTWEPMEKITTTRTSKSETKLNPVLGPFLSLVKPQWMHYVYRESQISSEHVVQY
jgi:hypothetical protein